MKRSKRSDENLQGKVGFPCMCRSNRRNTCTYQAPLENPTNYVNRNSFHSVVMQAYVDARYLFRDIVVGWLGIVHDARVLSNSDLYYRGHQGSLFDDNITVTLLGREMKPVILGDPAYPLLRWLIKGYPENQTTTNFQRYFNFRLSRARMSVENTFGRWKGRFRRFLKRVDLTVNCITAVIAASCIMHNICE